jgi:sulfonate transport system permease protein
VEVSCSMTSTETRRASRQNGGAEDPTVFAGSTSDSVEFGSGGPGGSALHPDLPKSARRRAKIKASGVGQAKGRTRVDGRKRHRWRRWITPVVVLALWQLGSNLGYLSFKTFSSPWQVADTAYQLMANGTLERALLVSLARVGVGLFIGVTAGLLLGLVSGLFRLGEDLIDPSLQMLRTMPVLALIPLFILWFGIGELPKVLIIGLGCFFSMYLNTFAGVRNVDDRLVEAGQTLGLSRWGQIRHVIIPGALPNALVGLRIAIGVSVIMLVVSEQINASSGIGYLMTQAEQFFQTSVIFVGLLVYALLGLSADLIVRFIEKRALAWRRTFAGT